MILSSLDIQPKMEFLDQLMVQFLIFDEPAQFSIVDEPITFPPTVNQDKYPFFHIFVNILYIFFNDSHSNGYDF